VAWVRVVSQAKARGRRIHPVCGLGTRGACRGRGGVGNDRGILGGAEHREFAGQSVYLGMAWLEHVERGSLAHMAYHCLLLFFELHVEIGGSERTRVPYGPRPGANSRVIAHGSGK
jgi:hypothetical protein